MLEVQPGIVLPVRRDAFQYPSKDGLVLTLPVKFEAPIEGDFKWYRGKEGYPDWGEFVLFHEGTEIACSEVLEQIQGRHIVKYNEVLYSVIVLLLPYTWRCEVAFLRNDKTWDSAVFEVPEELGDSDVPDSQIEIWWACHYGGLKEFEDVAGAKILNISPPVEMGTQYPLELVWDNPNES